MKVLMLGWEFPPFFSGGLGVVTKNLAISLGKRDLELCFALPYYIRKSVPQEAIPAGVFLADFDHLSEHIQKYTSVHYFKTSIPGPYTSPEQYMQKKEEWNGASPSSGFVPGAVTGNVAVYGQNLWEEIDRFAYQMERFVETKEFDVVHAHDWITCEAGIRVKLRKNIPLVIHVHATEIDRTGGNINQSVFDREKYAFDFADKLIAVSHYTKNILIQSYGIDAQKIYVVHNAHNITPSEDHHFPQWLIKKPKKDFIVLFIGRLTLQKGPDYFIKVAKRVLQENKNVKFVLAGTGDMMPEILSDIVREKMESNVFCLGFMNGSDKEKVYHNADLCLIPSVSEPFGLIALEAVEYGVPVLISHNSGAKEVLHHSLKSHFWEVEKMAHYILALYKYPVLRKMLAQESYRETRSLSWDLQAEKIHHIYNDLIQSS